MDPVDPKRRGRRLFGGRRRHEHAAEAEMDEPTTTADPDSSVSEIRSEFTPDDRASADTAPTGIGDRVSAAPEGTTTAPDGDPTVEDDIEIISDAEGGTAVSGPDGDPVIVDDDAVVPDAEPIAAPGAPDPGSDDRFGAAAQVERAEPVKLGEPDAPAPASSLDAVAAEPDGAPTTGAVAADDSSTPDVAPDPGATAAIPVEVGSEAGSPAAPSAG